MNDSEAYVWIDVIKEKLVDDCAPDKEIEALKHVQKMLYKEVTGYAEYITDIEGLKKIKDKMGKVIL